MTQDQDERIQAAARMAARMAARDISITPPQVPREKWDAAVHRELDRVEGRNRLTTQEAELQFARRAAAAAVAVVGVNAQNVTEEERLKACLEYLVRIGCHPEFNQAHGLDCCVSCLAFTVYAARYGQAEAEAIDPHGR